MCAGPYIRRRWSLPRVTAFVGENHNNNKPKRITQSFLQHTESHDFTPCCLSNLIPHVPGSLHNVFSGTNAGKSRSFILRGVQSHTRTARCCQRCLKHQVDVSRVLVYSGKTRRVSVGKIKGMVLFPHQQYI